LGQFEKLGPKEIVLRISEAEHSNFGGGPPARQIPELGAKGVPCLDGPEPPCPLSAEETNQKRVGGSLVRPAMRAPLGSPDRWWGHSWVSAAAGADVWRGLRVRRSSWPSLSAGSPKGF